MKIDVDVVSPIRRKIRVELPADAVDREFLRAYQSLGRRARVRGFRPGKAPRAVLYGLYGDEIRGEVFSRLVEHSLSEVIRERGLQVVSQPEVEANHLEEGRPFSFSAVVEVKPEVEVKNYLGLEVRRVKAVVDDGQVDAVLGQLQESHAQLEPVEERDVVQRGDFIVLDFVGAVDGKPLRGGKVENYQLEVGAGKALAQFEDALVGLKKDQEHTISVTYPTDHGDRELAGKVAEFRVVVREIKKKILPPLDDDFAKDHGECAALAELRSKIRVRLETELEEIQTQELEEQLLTRLVEANPFEAPPAMVEQRVRYLIERHSRRFAGRGSSGPEPMPPIEELRRELEPHALRQVKAAILFEKIAALEAIDVADAEVEDRIEALVRSAGQRGPALRDLYRSREAREDLRSQMAFERTLSFLLKRAKVREVAAGVAAQ